MRGGISGIGARQPRINRDWTLANQKVEEEGSRCRNWRSSAVHTNTIERAHIIGRSRDNAPPIRLGQVGWKPYVVAPDRIIPLCSACHRAQHDHELDLLPLLLPWEQIQAVADCGGSIAVAYDFLMPSENPKRT